MVFLFSSYIFLKMMNMLIKNFSLDFFFFNNMLPLWGWTHNIWRQDENFENKNEKGERERWKESKKKKGRNDVYYIFFRKSYPLNVGEQMCDLACDKINDITNGLFLFWLTIFLDAPSPLSLSLFLYAPFLSFAG